MDNKLFIKLLVWSEAMFFLFLIMSFVYYEYTSGYDQHALQSLDLKSTSIFTVLLIASSGTNWMAVQNYKKRSFKKLKMWMLVTIVLGIIFLYGEAKEYVHLFQEQITMSESTFGMNYFTLTGVHGLHVILGIIALSITWGLILAGDFKHGTSTVIDSVSIYWHFVDAVWIVVFTVIYILPVFT